MKLLAEFSHPAQVHKFKFVFRNLIAKGHQVLILARDKDVMLALLKAEKLPFKCISRAKTTLPGMALELISREIRTLKTALFYKPDIMLSAHSVAITHVGKLLRIPVVLHDDTEHASLQQKLYMPFADHIITSSAYMNDLGTKQIRINSIEPLMYLHPTYFSPDKSRLSKYGLSDQTPYAVLRLVSWNAAHDLGQSSPLAGQCGQLIAHLKTKGIKKFILSTEEPDSLTDDNDVLTIDPEDLHHILAFASLCISEGGSVAIESAALGTPTILVNPLQAGLFTLLEEYDLLLRSQTIGEVLQTIDSLLSSPNSTRVKWKLAQKRLLTEKNDMTKEIVLFLLDKTEKK